MAGQEIRANLVEQAKNHQLVLLLGQDWPQVLTGVLSNSELAKGLAEATGKPTSSSLAAIAQKLTRNRYSHFLRDNLPSQPPAEPYLTVAQIPTISLMTLAYDDRLEQALSQMNRQPFILVDDEAVAQRLPGNARPDLIKLCGDVAHSARLIVSRSEYQNMPDTKRTQLFQLVNQWLATKTVLVIGCDPSQGSDFDRCHYPFLLRRQGGFQAGAFLLWPEVVETDRARWAERNVTAVSTPDVPGFLEELLFDLENQVDPPPPGVETAALQNLMAMLVGQQEAEAINEAAADVPDNQRLQSIQLTFRLKLSETNLLQSELDVRSIPDIQSHNRQWRDTDIPLAELQEWATDAARRRKLKRAFQNSPVEETGIEFLAKMLAVDSSDWRAYAHALYLRQTFADSLSIVFELDDARLWPIPWELLHDGRMEFLEQLIGKGFLGLGYPIYRRPRTISSPGQVAGQIQRALVLAADPVGNLTQLEGEKQWLVETLQNVGVAVDVLGPDDTAVNNLSTIKQQIRDGNYQLLHFIGHGQFDEEAPTQSFLLLGQPGEPETKLSAAELAQVAQESGLTFVFLSACQAGDAAEADEDRPWEETGLVNGLLQNGVPAALGMRWNIGDVSARRLVTVFYTELLLAGRSIEQAMLSARRELQTGVEWANPVFSKRHGVL